MKLVQLMNRPHKSIKLFSVPVSITSLPQALALIGRWVREWRSVISSQLSVFGSESVSYRFIGLKPANRKPANQNLTRLAEAPAKRATENRKPITGYPKLIFTPNPEIIVAAQSDPKFLAALQAADLAIPDGIGVVWALKLLSLSENLEDSDSQIVRKSDSRKTGSPPIRLSDIPTIRPSGSPSIPSVLTTISRVSGIDLMESLISDLPRILLKESPLKIMLLGGRPGVAAAAAKILSEYSENSESRTIRKSEIQKAGKSDSPTLRQSDFSGSPSFPSVLKIKAVSGPQDISKISPAANSRLIAQINSFAPDLLFVAFGHGKQERWLIANREQLNVGVAMGVGGALDQIADPSLRPPAYINSIGLGWLYRLLRQPWRAKRQLALGKFVGMVIRKMKN